MPKLWQALAEPAAAAGLGSPLGPAAKRALWALLLARVGDVSFVKPGR